LLLHPPPLSLLVVKVEKILVRYLSWGLVGYLSAVACDSGRAPRSCCLRLAIWEVGLIDPFLWIPWIPLMLAMYESNCRMFGCSRVVGVPFIARMMLAPMVQLTCEELLQLHAGLEHALSTDFHTQEGVDWRPLATAMPNLWLMPTLRS
jgi:hypothetical protein